MTAHFERDSLRQMLEIRDAELEREQKTVAFLRLMLCERDAAIERLEAEGRVAHAMLEIDALKAGGMLKAEAELARLRAEMAREAT